MGDEYWILLYVPVKGPDADVLADQAAALKGVLGATKYGELTVGVRAELEASAARIAAAASAAVMTERAGGTGPTEKGARQYITRHMERRYTHDEEWIARHLGEYQPGEDWWLIIQLDVDPALTMEEKQRLRDLLEGRPEVLAVIPTP